jgi:hypothetical protein
LIENAWVVQMNEIKEAIRRLTRANEQLEKELREVKSERDFLQTIIDSVGGRG